MSLYRKIKRIVFYTIMACAVLVIGIHIFNYFAFQRLLQKVIREDCRNEGIVALSHLDNQLDYRVLVYDVRQVRKPGGPIGVFRVMFQYSKMLENWDFQTVVISYRGAPKFMLDGAQFKELGQMYGNERPIEIVKTLAHNLRFMNGDRVMARVPGNYAALLKQELNGGEKREAEVDPTNHLIKSLTLQ